MVMGIEQSVLLRKFNNSGMLPFPVGGKIGGACLAGNAEEACLIYMKMVVLCCWCNIQLNRLALTILSIKIVSKSLWRHENVFPRGPSDNHWYLWIYVRFLTEEKRLHSWKGSGYWEIETSLPSQEPFSENMAIWSKESEPLTSSGGGRSAKLLEAEKAKKCLPSSEPAEGTSPGDAWTLVWFRASCNLL